MITDRIRDTLVQFEVDTGVEPTVVYLGHREFAELKRYAREVCCFFVEEPHTESHRCEFMGRKVYEVNAEEYLAVS